MHYDVFSLMLIGGGVIAWLLLILVMILSGIDHSSASAGFYGQDVAARTTQNESYQRTLEDANDFLENNGGGNC